MEKGDMHMQEVMRIGDDFVLADKDIKDIGHAGTEITDIARKYKADVLAVIGKGDEHNLVAQHHAHDTELWQDIAKIVILIQAIADAYKVSVADVAEVTKFIIDKGDA